MTCIEEIIYVTMKEQVESNTDEINRYRNSFIYTSVIFHAFFLFVRISFYYDSHRYVQGMRKKKNIGTRILAAITAVA